MRTVAAIAISHGFDAHVCIHEGSPAVVLEIVNRTLHSADTIKSPSGVQAFAEACREKTGASSVAWKGGGGSCWTICLKSAGFVDAHVITDMLATTRIVDVWALNDQLQILYAPMPKHTSALAHLREQRPELFSPQHCRTLADQSSSYAKGTRAKPKRGARFKK
jgi:hypothetical protein